MELLFRDVYWLWDKVHFWICRITSVYSNKRIRIKIETQLSSGFSRRASKASYLSTEIIGTQDWKFLYEYVPNYLAQEISGTESEAIRNSSMLPDPIYWKELEDFILQRATMIIDG